MTWNGLGDIVSLQTIFIGLLLILETFNYYQLDKKTDDLKRDFDIFKRSKISQPDKLQDDCCFKFQVHERRKRSDLTRLESNQEGPARGEKGEKGDKGIRGPPGLPGMKGDTGDCGCYTTAAYETPPPPTLGPKQQDCGIARIGLPLHQAAHDTYWGFWSRDDRADSADKYWMTEHFEGRYLYSFDDPASMKNHRTTHDLSPAYYFGTGHVIYNGSLVYHEAGTNRLNKFDLDSGEVTHAVSVPGAAHESNAYLYSSNYSYFDLAVDENGLWVVYRRTPGDEGGHDLAVSKLDPLDLSVRFTRDVPARSRDFGESFVACGNLYLIGDTTSTSTHLEHVYDLYEGN